MSQIDTDAMFPADLGGYEDDLINTEAIEAVADVLHDLACLRHFTDHSCTCFRHAGDADHLQAHTVLTAAATPGPVAEAFRVLLPPTPQPDYKDLWNTWAGSKAAIEDIIGRLTDAASDDPLDEITRDALHAMKSVFVDDKDQAWTAMTTPQRHRAFHDWSGVPSGSLECCAEIQGTRA